MNYVGLQTQIRRNTFRSVLMLILFPCVILGLTWLGLFLFEAFGYTGSDQSYMEYYPDTISYSPSGEKISSLSNFLSVAPWVIAVCTIWFIIAYFSHSFIINKSTGARTLERRENKRVYNLVENVCIANGMQMPIVNVIEDDSLNAYASGINKKNFTVTLSRGIIDKLDDLELEAVIAHELSHIKNHDVKVMMVSIVFVGIFSFLTQFLSRILIHRPRVSSGKNDKGGGAILIVLILVLAIIGYAITILMKLAISRKREYMADAGSVEMTKNPQALASALRKISKDPLIEAIEQNDVAQLFIENPMKKGASFLNELFATHPPIEKRIAFLEQL